jgi:hypothetical protein
VESVATISVYAPALPGVPFVVTPVEYAVVFAAS